MNLQFGAEILPVSP